MTEFIIFVTAWLTLFVICGVIEYFRGGFEPSDDPIYK